MSKQQNDPSLKNFESLEAHLAGTLRPVTLPKDFVHRLRDRVHLPERAVIVSRLRDWNRLFVVFGRRDVGHVGHHHRCPGLVLPVRTQEYGVNFANKFRP